MFDLRLILTLLLSRPWVYLKNSEYFSEELKEWTRDNPWSLTSVWTQFHTLKTSHPVLKLKEIHVWNIFSFNLYSDTLHFFKIMVCCSQIFVSSLIYTPYLIMMKNFRNVCKCIKKKKLEHHIFISIQTLCSALNWSMWDVLSFKHDAW